MTTLAARPAPVVITALQDEHAEFAAALHAAQLPHGFFARLGTPFLQGYYRAFARSPHAIALHASVDGRPAGALVGTVGHRAHYRWMLHAEGRRLLVTAVLGFVRSPQLAWRFLRTRGLRYLRGVRRLERDGDRTSAPSAQPGRTAVLTHVSVMDDAKGYGVGTVLVEAFLTEAARGGATKARLSTLAGPEGAGGFYDRLGWKHVADATDYDGRRIEIYATSTNPRER